MFYSETSRKPGYQKERKYRNTNQRIVKSELNVKTRNQNQKIKPNRQELGRIENGYQRGVVYNLSIIWLTKIVTK